MKLREGFSFINIISELKKLLTVEGEYLSHSTALFILGQISTFPPSITIVSPRRRRNRVIQGVPLVFILHPPHRLKPTQNISFGKETLCVSTLEKTLIDLLADLDHAPPSTSRCQLFASLPFDNNVLFNFAKITSDGVLERVSYPLAW